MDHTSRSNDLPLLLNRVPEKNWLDNCMGYYDFTSMCSVSMLGKHLRRVTSILISFKTPKLTLKANIFTPGSTVLGLGIVAGCNGKADMSFAQITGNPT
jgi:hypothetical protein